MSLSAEEIADVVAELQSLVGGTVQKIFAPTPRTAIFELRVPGSTHLLLFSAEPDETRLHRAEARPASPPVPLPLQNLLRAHLLPSRLVGLRRVEGERIVEARFETPRGARTLKAELTGRHGNLILLGEEEKILGLAVQSPSTTRALLPGQRYELPPPPPTTRSAPPRRRFPKGEGAFDVSAAIEAHYAPRSRERVLADHRREAARGIAAARKRVGSALTKLQEESSRAQRAEDFRRYGDLLKTMVGRIPRGAKSVVATEYTETGVEAVVIPLRPELSARANLERFYKDYRRMRVAQERIESRQSELGERAQQLARLSEALNAAQTEAEIDDIARRAASLGARPSKQGRKVREEPRPPYRGFVSAAGRPIWVGRGARENDRLTFRFAKTNDLWFHARGLPGAHVVAPLAKGGTLDEETLLDACALAAHYSGAKGEAVAEIAWTEVRNVRKIKGSAPGAVLFTQERVVAYRHDDRRIARLLGQLSE